MTGLEILGKNVKRYRQLKDLTQEDLAKKAMLAKDTISLIELDKQPNPGLKNLISISQELDIELYQLFLEDPDMLNIKFIVGNENLKSLEKLLNEIDKRVEIRFKVDIEKPIFYHPSNCKCEKCKEKGGEKNDNNKGN